MNTMLQHLDATELASLIRRGDVSPVEAVRSSIDTIERLEPDLNAVAFRRFDEALHEAARINRDAPFAGVPILLKDSGVRQTELPETKGTRALREAGIRATEDSPLGASLRRVGFITVGVATCPDLSILSATRSDAYGVTNNPWNQSLTPGGSSGGSAAAVAARYVAFAHGNDGGGSIRLPGGWCGVIALKPSRGRVLTDDETFSYTVCDFGFCRSVRDVRGILAALDRPRDGALLQAHEPAGGALPRKRLRIGVASQTAAGPVDPQCSAAAEAVGLLLESAGHDVEQIDFATFETASIQNAVTLSTVAYIFAKAGAVAHRIGRPLREGDVDVVTWLLLQNFPKASATDVLGAWSAIQGWSRVIADWWRDRIDILVTPTAPETAPPSASMAFSPADPVGPLMKTAWHTTFLNPFSLTGQPAISLPVATATDGMPIGVQLVARHGRDDLLLRISEEIELRGGLRNATPPVCAPV
jgi:amidase